jgi:hypothetical protein
LGKGNALSENLKKSYIGPNYLYLKIIADIDAIFISQYILLELTEEQHKPETDIQAIKLSSARLCDKD